MPEAATEFLNYGVLGAVTCLLLGAVLYLFRELRASEKARLTDMQPVVVALESNARTLAAIATATENRTRSSDAIAESVKFLTQELEHLERTVHALERRSP